MRALFLLLLLANLLFAAWALWVAPHESGAGQPTAAAGDAGRILLLSEAPTAPPEAEQTPDAGMLDPYASDLACVSVGPFLEPAEAERATARLAGLGFTVRVRESREDVRVGQWVRIEGLATPEDATNAQRALQLAGLAEAYVLTEDDGSVVSLGVYSDPLQAAEIAAVAQAAGYEPRTTDRLRSEDVRWLDVDRQASGGLPAVDDLQAIEGARSHTIGMRPCPSPEAQTDARGPAP